MCVHAVVLMYVCPCLHTHLCVYQANYWFQPRLCSKLPIPLPVELLAVITGTVISMLTDLEAKYNISVVGDIPTG